MCVKRNVNKNSLLMPDGNEAVLDEASGLFFIYSPPAQIDPYIDFRFWLRELKKADQKEICHD